MTDFTKRHHVFPKREGDRTEVWIVEYDFKRREGKGHRRFAKPLEFGPWFGDEQVEGTLNEPKPTFIGQLDLMSKMDHIVVRSEPEQDRE